jgi:hypothetical protein
VVPVRAEQYSTLSNDENKNGAHRAIDLDLNTNSYTAASSTPWFKVILDRVHCVDQVVHYYNNYDSANNTWTCSNTRCSCHGGTYSCNQFPLTVSLERATSQNFPTVSDCRYGDTVKIQGSSSYTYVSEISVTAKQGEITHWYVRYVCTLRDILYCKSAYFSSCYFYLAMFLELLKITLNNLIITLNLR